MTRYGRYKRVFVLELMYCRSSNIGLGVLAGRVANSSEAQGDKCALKALELGRRSQVWILISHEVARGVGNVRLLPWFFGALEEETPHSTEPDPNRASPLPQPAMIESE